MLENQVHIWEDLRFGRIDVHFLNPAPYICRIRHHTYSGKIHYFPLMFLEVHYTFLWVNPVSIWLLCRSLGLCCLRFSGNLTSHLSRFLWLLFLMMVSFGILVPVCFCSGLWVRWFVSACFCINVDDSTGTIMTISKDRVKPCPRPDGWN